MHDQVPNKALQRTEHSQRSRPAAELWRCPLRSPWTMRIGLPPAVVVSNRTVLGMGCPPGNERADTTGGEDGIAIGQPNARPVLP